MYLLLCLVNFTNSS